MKLFGGFDTEVLFGGIDTEPQPTALSITQARESF